jgi:hypothetical protein
MRRDAVRLPWNFQYMAPGEAVRVSVISGR